MITFDWPKFFGEHAIFYVTRGPNVGRGEVAIRCPWCGPDDPSHHMAINLGGAGWRCWRNPAMHSGKSPVRLIQALLHCDYRMAASIAGVSALATSGMQPFDEQIRSILGGPIAARAQKPLAAGLPMPKEFMPLHQARNFTSGRPFLLYLEKRGFQMEHAERLCFEYDLRFCVTGAFAGRIIIPVFLKAGMLASWTGRTVDPHNPVRYKTLTTDPEKAEAEGSPLALLPISHCLWNIHQAAGHTLVVCEGPFDAINVDVRGAKQGIRATCLFTKSISITQKALLNAVSGNFDRKVVLLDRDASADAVSLASQLAFLGFELNFLPPGVKDPAELSTEQVWQL